MNEENLRQLIEEIDPENKIPADKIEEFVSALKEQKKHSSEDGNTYLSVGELKEKLEQEADWRKRVSICAKNISKGLE